MKIFIVEDEDLAVKKLIKTLHSINPDLEITGTADSIASTVQWLEEHPHPDLILMDIELSDGQSFEIFNRIEVKSPVIFTTSYDEYALKAFKVNSIDYLLKPIQKEELELALSKFKKLRGDHPDPSESVINIKQLMNELRQNSQPKEYRKRFLVKHAQKLISIDIEQIRYFYSEDRLNFFKTMDDKKYLVDYSMDEIEEMLDPDKFFRINRAFIVAIKSIDQINDYFGNRLKLVLNPAIDKETIVSREKVSDFKEWMGK
ncbi:MAG TPA: LytTR family DNA-binding domain-containing protein [Saprospiraceae bacterium]|nr:response regulator transcription factor [Saprospiraceae bacterium]HRG68243.1 LytTR family DNA-binding domain-containing protein [Saprospiraceae bacterium]